MAELKDFGKKIGGARKDVWGGRGLTSSDLTEMNEFERQSHIKKDNIWLKPDWVELVKNGTPQGVAYWQNKMRQSIPPKPPKDDQETQDNYLKVVEEIRDAVMAIKTPGEIDTFYRTFIRENYVAERDHSYYVRIIPEADGVITNKVLKAAQSKYSKMEREAKEKLFGIAKDEQAYIKTKNDLSIYYLDGHNTFLTPLADSYHTAMLTASVSFGRRFYYFEKSDDFSDPDNWEKGSYFVMDDNRRKPIQINFGSREEAEIFIEEYARNAQKQANKTTPEKGKSGKRKGVFTPPQLKHIRRDGPNYRGLRQANSEMFLQDLKFRGGEFGNWLNNDDRQASLDMAYDGLRDLARVLGIHPEDISLNGRLAIAFGARGRGGANAGAAHYEPDRQVINLTKMSGAGCLAHEWGHALDHAIGIAEGQVVLASEGKKVPDSFKAVLNSLKYKTVSMTPEEAYEAERPRIERAKKNLKNWITSVKPSTMPEGMSQKWESITEGIIDNAAQFTGAEYFSMRRGDEVLTNPDVEMLSQLRKFALWKDDRFFSSRGKKLTGPMVNQMLSKRRIKLKGCISQKSGKKYDCIVYVDFSGQYPQYRMEFVHSK